MPCRLHPRHQDHRPGSCHLCYLYETRADYRGKWSVELGLSPAGAPALVPCPTCPGSVQFKVHQGMRADDLLKLLRGPYPQGGWPAGWPTWPVTREAHVRLLGEVIAAEHTPPDGLTGDGVVIVGGGKYWPGIVVSVRMLREVSDIPVQVWYRGKSEAVNPADLAGVGGVQLIDADAVRDQENNSPLTRILNGWEIKTFALRRCGWRRVLYLDADAYCVADPEPLLYAADYAGMVFWTDLGSTNGNLKWDAAGLPDGTGTATVQGGQFALDLVTCWRELVIADHCNQHSDYHYKHQFGDQDSWRLAFAATGRAHLVAGPARWVSTAFVCDWEGAPMIVHRCRGKLFRPRDIPKGKTNYANPKWHLPGEERAFGYLTRVLNAEGADAASTFGHIYSHGLWGPTPGLSGAGSLPQEAAPYLAFAVDYLRTVGVQSVVDLGSGDGAVLRALAERLPGVQLHGVEVHGPHVERLRREAPGIAWHCLDLDRDRERLPAGDVAILKDVLHHWPNALVTEWLRWAIRSGRWRHLLLVQDVHQRSDGQDTHLGGYRALHPDMQPLREFRPRLLGQYLHKAAVIVECETR